MHDSVLTELERLERRKRRAYLIASVLLAGVIGVNALTAPGPFTWVYLVTWAAGVVLVALLPLLFSTRVPLRVTEVALFFTGSVIVFVGLTEYLFPEGPMLDRALALVGTQYWTVGIMIILAFVMLGRRGGLLLGSLVWVASAGLTTLGYIRQTAAGYALHPLNLVLPRLHVMLMVVLVLVWVLTGMREHYHRALERAEVLATQALTDPLTGLSNRYAAEQRFAAEFANAARSGQSLSVLMFDLDHFKQINDTHGHDAGDEVLVAISRALREELRSGDLLARWGGEELVALLPGAGLSGAVNLAERCRVAVAEARPLRLEVTVTVGVAEHLPGESARTLLQRADTALYQGKSLGRNQVVVATSPTSS